MQFPTYALSVKPLQPNGHYMYRQFNIQHFYFLPTQCIYVFCVVWEQTAIISLYSINWLVCITEMECLLRGTDWVFIYNSGYVFYVDLRTNSDYFPVQH